jgi:hypothetical protein
LTSTIASRLGPAKPRGIGCERAGASVTASQSRQENFSRTCSIIPAPRLTFKGLRYPLAKLVQPLTATFTAGARRGFDDTFDRRLSGRGRRGGRGFVRASAWRLLVPGSRQAGKRIGRVFGQGLRSLQRLRTRLIKKWVFSPKDQIVASRQTCFRLQIIRLFELDQRPQDREGKILTLL